MAEPWNRINIPFPSAASQVHIQLTSTTAGILKFLSLENEKVLTLMRSKILQTEIRVMYELLYVMNNSHRQNKTFRGLKQVEQCINRLKNMKLDAALQDLTDLCPNKIQLGLCIKSGRCDVPSQPKLEWTCLKVLGACKLLCCTLSRCSRTFIFSKLHMKWEEFIILNLVITSMLSRLWVIFRGILVGLTILYQNLLKLLKDVAQAQPMPYLTNISLPVDVAEFLGPSDALLLKTYQSFSTHIKNPKAKQKAKKKGKNKQQKEMTKEDLGVLVKRGPSFDADIKPFFIKGKSVSGELHQTGKKQKLVKQVKDAITFTQMSACLEEMILHCKSLGMKKTKRLLSFLHVKCKRMKCLEAAGYNMQRKLKVFRQDVCVALSPQRSGARTFHFSTLLRSTASLRRHLRSVRTRFMVFKFKTGAKKTPLSRKRKESELPEYFKNNKRSRATGEASRQVSDSGGNNDIDDIFASAGL